MGTILVVDIKMKTAILVLFISLTIFAITESCLVVNCSGVTAATCTSPCYQCGACRQNCCQRVFLGRDGENGMTKENGTDRFFLQTSCASSGRNDEERTDFKDIEFLEKKSFDVCDIDEDGGLSWDEVEICEENYKDFLKIDHLPTKEDFDHFDADSNGVLFFDEWEGSNVA